jgi:hypothetical protein
MTEQKYFDQVAHEIATHQLDQGLWARAFSEAMGEEKRAKAIYISLRAEQIKTNELVAHRAALAVAADRLREVEQHRLLEAETAMPQEMPTAPPRPTNYGGGLSRLWALLREYGR